MVFEPISTDAASSVPTQAQPDHETYDSLVMLNLFETQAVPISITGYAQIALEQGIDASPNGLTYAIPESVTDLQVGDRVIVPLGKRNKPVAGYVIAVTHGKPTSELLSATAELAKVPISRIKPIVSHDPAAVSLTDDLVDLAQWIASYYCCPLGMVFATMLPAAVKRGAGRVTRTMVGLPSLPLPSSTDPPSPHAALTNVKIPKLQKEILVCVQQLADDNSPWTEIKQLALLAGAKTVTPIKQLIAKGLLTTERQTTVGSGATQDALIPTGQPAVDIQPTGDQQKAIDHLAGHIHNGFSVHLLHGVTGSGKTLVYLRVIEQVFARFKCSDPNRDAPGAIVLVPEIALTAQTVARFVDRFDGVAALHSGLTAAQRHEQWRRIRCGQARIVIGARSAIFAPLPNVGVIIVDEEHDASYKQDQLPRYSGRDVAIKRAQNLKIPVLLGSATPSLESYFNATHHPIIPGETRCDTRRSYHLLQLPKRVTALQLPKVTIVDMKEERRLRQDRHIHLLSQRLEQSLHNTLAAKSQAILLLNRRGFANYIACPDHRCGWLMNCNDCDAMMVYHKHHNLPTGGLLRCHHCQAQQILPPQCPVCNKKVTVFGVGTQRVEEEIERKFPGVRLLRMDSDSMHTARNYQDGLDAFGRGELDVLIGTQMVAKGLDFPNVRLVGVISADTSLHMPDFRASERTFQLIAQVAGRAGRGSAKQTGSVIVQTFNPDDPAIVLASQHDYDAFARREIELRHQVILPPWSRMARIVLRDRDHRACDDRAKTLAHHLQASITSLQFRDLVLMRGPMPCPIARIAGFHRQQIELTACEPAAAANLQKLLTQLRNARMLRSDAHTAVDVDPVGMM